MDLRKGKYYIVRYSYDSGMREYYNKERDEFKLGLSDATGYETTILANRDFNKFENNCFHHYSVHFYDN